jgi:hypothetical protein
MRPGRLRPTQGLSGAPGSVARRPPARWTPGRARDRRPDSTQRARARASSRAAGTLRERLPWRQHRTVAPRLRRRPGAGRRGKLRAHWQGAGRRPVAIECPQFLESGHWNAIALAASRSYDPRQRCGCGIELPLWSRSDACVPRGGSTEPSPGCYACANAGTPRVACACTGRGTSAPVPPGHPQAMRWLLGFILPAATRLARIHLVRESRAPVAVRTPRPPRCASAPRLACILELLIIIAVLARPAPDRAHVATSRVLALLG